MDAMAPDASRSGAAGARLGPFRLVPGVTAGHATAYLASSFALVLLGTFLGFVQPYLLNDVLRVPPGAQGSVTGALALINELTALALMGFAGAVSDRAGRRGLATLGFLLWAAGLVLLPFATSLTILYGFRVLLAVAAAITLVTVVTTLQDYPAEVSRGAWGGFNTCIGGFAVLAVSLGLARLPSLLQGAGHDPVSAGRLTYGAGALVALLAALVTWRGWYQGRFGAGASPDPVSGLAAGLRAARRNPRLAVAFAAGFASRGDMMVVGSFYSLWFLRAGADQGLDGAAALERAGLSFTALLLATLLWAPLFGAWLDRVDRLRGLAVAMALAAAGYLAISLVADPFATRVVVAATLALGIGEISAIVSANALAGQEAPEAIRGATFGALSVTGTFGILFAMLAGGAAFDRIGYTAPFALMAALNGLVAIMAILVLARPAQDD